MSEEEYQKLRDDILTGKVLRWDVNSDNDDTREKLSRSHGYFGQYIVIQVGDKKTVIFIDDRDGICKPILAEWYDDVIPTDYFWNADERFESNPNRNPVLVSKNGKWTMIGLHGNRNEKGLRIPYCDEWYDRISPKRHWNNSDGDWYEAFRYGQTFRLTSKCSPIQENIADILAEVNGWGKDKILRDWIRKGKPCYAISGFRYKGASPCPITKEEAAAKIKVHSFGIGYHSLDWSVENGKVALVFATYSEGDME